MGRSRRERKPGGRGRAAAVLLVFAAAAVGAVLPARTATLEAARIRETLLPNGLRLVVKEAHAVDLAAVQVWIRAGGFLEDEQSSGMAHAIEHLAFKTSEERVPRLLDAEVENLGGLIEAATDRDWTRFNCTVAGRYVGRLIPLIADALRKPGFTQKDLEAEKPVLLEELNQVAFNPEAAVSRMLYQLAFRRHTYRRDVRGTPASVNQLALEPLRAFYERYYVPANVTLVVVGDVDAAAVERTARAAFAADAPAPPAVPQLPEPERPCEQAERRILASGFANGYVGIAWPGPSVKDEPDIYAMDLLLTMLESDGTGRLPRLLRNRAAVQATFETRRQAGLFLVFAASSGRIEQVEELIRREMELLVSRPIPEEELTLAKRTLRGQYALDNEPYSGQAGTLGYYASIDRWQFACDYLDRVERVTTQQAQEVARKYFDPQRSVAVVLRPRQEPGPQPAPGGPNRAL